LKIHLKSLSKQRKRIGSVWLFFFVPMLEFPYRPIYWQALLFTYRIGLHQVTPLGVVFLFMLVNWWVEKHQRFLFNVYKRFFISVTFFTFFNVFYFFYGTFFFTSMLYTYQCVFCMHLQCSTQFKKSFSLTLQMQNIWSHHQSQLSEARLPQCKVETDSPISPDPSLFCKVSLFFILLSCENDRSAETFVSMKVRKIRNAMSRFGKALRIWSWTMMS